MNPIASQKKTKYNSASAEQLPDIQHIPSTPVPCDAACVEQKNPKENGFWSQASLATNTDFLLYY